MDAAQRGKTSPEQKPGYKDRFWIPRFWDGICPSGYFRLLWQNRFAVSFLCIAMAMIIGCAEFHQLRPLAHSGRFVGAKDRPHADRARSDFRDRPLAFGHDLAARVVGARPATHVPRHLRLLRAEPFSGVGLVDEAVSEGADALAAADRQHAGRLGSTRRKTSLPCATWASLRPT